MNHIQQAQEKALKDFEIGSQKEFFKDHGKTLKEFATDFILDLVAQTIKATEERIVKTINNDNSKQFDGFLIVGTYKKHIINLINNEL